MRASACRPNSPLPRNAGMLYAVPQKISDLNQVNNHNKHKHTLLSRSSLILKQQYHAGAHFR